MISNYANILDISFVQFDLNSEISTYCCSCNSNKFVSLVTYKYG